MRINRSLIIISVKWAQSPMRLSLWTFQNVVDHILHMSVTHHCLTFILRYRFTSASWLELILKVSYWTYTAIRRNWIKSWLWSNISISPSSINCSLLKLDQFSLTIVHLLSPIRISSCLFRFQSIHWQSINILVNFWSKCWFGFLLDFLM